MLTGTLNALRYLCHIDEQLVQKMNSEEYFCFEKKHDEISYLKPPWRNGLACWTSTSKVVGSSPTGGGLPFIFSESKCYNRCRISSQTIFPIFFEPKFLSLTHRVVFQRGILRLLYQKYAKQSCACWLDTLPLAC